MTEVSLGNAQPAKRSGGKAKKAKQPTRRSGVQVSQEPEGPSTEQLQAERAAAAEPVDTRVGGASVVPDDFSGQSVPPQPPANPYIATGWRPKQHTEFDLTMPSGQLCRVRRLERDDLLRMDLFQYLDTFTPLLMQDTISEAERERQMTETVQENPEALAKMLRAIDMVVMAATVKPKITEDRKRVDYGTERDWNNPEFTPVVHLDDIETFERMYIFGAAFGRDMEDLKSVLQQSTQGVAGVAT
jgi:hypothetical protein